MVSVSSESSSENNFEWFNQNGALNNGEEFSDFGSAKSEKGGEQVLCTKDK